VGLLGDFAGGILKGGLEGIVSSASKIKELITGEPSVDKKLAIERELMNIQATAQNAQNQVNLAEAQHKSIFVAGWRPAIGWICATGLGYNFIIYPFLCFFLKIYMPDIAPPTIDSGTLMSLVLGMLGMGTLRTYEKLKGVNR